MSESLYVSCAQVLSVCQGKKDDLAALLDPETGYAPCMRQVCHDQIVELEDGPSSRSLRQEIEVLCMEQNTWGLLQAIMPARQTDPPNFLSAKDLLLENPYTPTSTLAQAIIQASPLLSELIVVREWLQETAPTPSPPEANTGYWKFTKHSVMQSLRTGNPQRDGLVTEMDPDAVNRGDGAILAADDASYEKSLLQALYGYVRAGRLDDAVEVCRRAHQPWRAASIRGSLLFQWGSLSTGTEQELSDDEGDIEPEFWIGNPSRRLWKSSCIRAALSSSLSDQERLLYAVLAPSLQTASVLKSACRTWEDHLWAEISIMCEEKASQELAKLGGSFWEGGIEAVEVGAQDTPPEQDEVDEGDWETEVSTTLDNLKGVAVVEGPRADHPFHVSQLFIILDRTDLLLDVFAAGLEDGTYPRSSVEYTCMCRFFAHFCFFLQLIDIPVPLSSTKIIIESYLEVLEEAGQRELIAMYTGALGQDAVERYAMFLVSLALSADINERRLALTRAGEHGLDMERIAIFTAERTIDNAFRVLPALRGPLPSIIARQAPPSEAELILLRSIEWTTFSEDTFNTALEQANVIFRYFLAAGRIQLAQSLLELLPIELVSIPEPEEKATEYLHYRQFFTVWDVLESVVECQSQDVPGLDRERKAAWLNRYRGLIDQAYDRVVKLLTTEWLISDVDLIVEESRRRFELIRIRQIYVPELILRLHNMLFTSRQMIPENLSRALQLVNIIADSRYRLYDDFKGVGGRSLSDYLGAVRQGILGGLENGGSDPFRVATAH